MITLLLLLACTRDPDDDLLTRAEELTLSTDADNPDSDNDGLPDGLEQLFTFTDPAHPDSDRDGAIDGWEVQVGLDPLDPRSRRYHAGWPHLDAARKAELLRDPAPALATRGARVRDLFFRDLHGQLVDLYDFALDRKPLVLFLGATAHVDDLLHWLTDRDSPLPASEPPDELRKRVIDGSLRLLLILHEDPDGGPAVPATLRPLAERHATLDHLPLLLDQGFAAWGHLHRPALNDPDRASTAFTFFALDQRMTVVGVEDWWAALELVEVAD